jgi:hypothetical protein
MDGESFIQGGKTVFEVEPLLREVHLTESRDALKNLLRSPGLARVKVLHSYGDELDERDARLLARFGDRVSV